MAAWALHFPGITGPPSFAMGLFGPSAIFELQSFLKIGWKLAGSITGPNRGNAFWLLNAFRIDTPNIWLCMLLEKDCFKTDKCWEIWVLVLSSPICELNVLPRPVVGINLGPQTGGGRWWTGGGRPGRWLPPGTAHPEVDGEGHPFLGLPL